MKISRGLMQALDLLPALTNSKPFEVFFFFKYVLACRLNPLIKILTHEFWQHCSLALLQKSVGGTEDLTNNFLVLPNFTLWSQSAQAESSEEMRQC